MCSKFALIPEKTVDKFSQALIDTDTPDSVIREAIYEAQGLNGEPNLRDQAHFCEILTESEEITDKNLKKTAEELKKVIEEVVIQNRINYNMKDANGLTAEFDFSDLPQVYENLTYAQSTKWNEAMSKFMIDKKNI